MINILKIIALLCAVGWMIFDFHWEALIVFIGLLINFINMILKPKKKDNNLLWFLGGATVGAIVVSENQTKKRLSNNIKR